MECWLVASRLSEKVFLYKSTKKEEAIEHALLSPAFSVCKSSDVVASAISQEMYDVLSRNHNCIHSRFPKYHEREDSVK